MNVDWWWWAPRLIVPCICLSQHLITPYTLNSSVQVQQYVTYCYKAKAKAGQNVATTSSWALRSMYHTGKHVCGMCREPLGSIQ